MGGARETHVQMTEPWYATTDVFKVVSFKKALRQLPQFNLPGIAIAVSAATLGRALQISSGTYNPDALWWVGVALVFCLFGTLAHRTPDGWSSRTGMLTISALLAGGILWQVEQLLSTRPGVSMPEQASLVPFQTGIALEYLLVVLAVLGFRGVGRIWFPLVLLTHLLLGVWTIHGSPTPAIDVVVVHDEAMKALLHGSDPYRISFPNIYGDNWKYYYNPVVVFGDRIGFGYPYPPPSLLLAIPGYLLFGDYRYSELAYLIVAAALIGYSRKHLAARLAAVLLLTTPRGFFVLEQGWTEPMTIFLVALTTFLLRRGPLKASWAAGLMLSTKQYLAFTGLAVVRFLLLDRRRWYFGLLTAAGVAGACTLPFALWHPNSFMFSVVWLQTIEPFRGDSLSFLIWADRSGWGQGSYLWAVGAGIVAAIVSLFTTRNTPSGFATSAAVTMFAMFALGSKAFCNYYYFVIGALCCAVAAFPGPEEDEQLVR